MVCMALHENIFAALTDHFAFLLFAKTWRTSLTLLFVPNDVQMFDADAILYGDTWCKKMDISMFLAVFSVRF